MRGFSLSTHLALSALEHSERIYISWGAAPGFFITRRWRLSLKIFAIVVRLVALRKNADSFRAFSAKPNSSPPTWGVAPGFYIARLWRFTSNVVSAR